MTATELLTNLRARGLRLWSRDGGLYVAPRAVLVEADRAAITAHKSALLTLLADVEARGGDDWSAVAIDVFPGAEIILDTAGADWPPPGGWLPTREGASFEGRPMRDGDPGIPRFMTRDRTQSLIVDDDPLLLQAGTHRFPCILLGRARVILGTNLAWRAFAATASPRARAAAQAALDRLTLPGAARGRR
jgi:hypothetical protein